MSDAYLSRIVVDPAVCDGQPHVAGTTIEVTRILEALAQGATVAEILGDYPVLSPLDLQAAAAFSAAVVRKVFTRSTPES